jgi:para-aminobenzoate synthetase/4-amino-4-deoxychorismate lyase
LIQTNEILLHDNNQWLHFSSPHRIIEVHDLHDVMPALREIEDLVNDNGWYAAGFLSYASAPAFDRAHVTRTDIRPERSGVQSKDLPIRESNPSSRASTALLDGHSSFPYPTGTKSAREIFPYLWFGLYPSPRLVTKPEPDSAKPALNWSPTIDRDTYNTAIAQIKDHIAEGRTYQVNYTMRLQTVFNSDPWNFFLHLARSQNDHAAYIDTGRYVIASASPELFFKLDGDTVTCRPMKGTVKRGRTTLEDNQQAEWLHNSEKNRAENVMIVDMIRNDLGRIAKIGSVQVPELFAVEKYPTLWQMTSTVTAKTDVSVTKIFSALFPCASITGAPKVSTMRIISELETTPRNIYTGSIGYIAPNRKARFNVAIRTALIDRETHSAEYGVGGGIVWDSTSTDEYAEALLKARVLTESMPEFSLLETMLWTPEEGFFLREKHIARLLDSAEYFDFPIKRRGKVTPSLPLHEIINVYLNEISSQFQSSQRVRVLLDKNGDLSFESKEFTPSENQSPLKVCLAREPIHSENIFLFHKTTHRDVYAKALGSVGAKPQKEHGGYDDVILYNEHSQVTEFSIGNIVVEINDRLYTPLVSCGLLAGTFRAYLLETGQVEERTVRLEELNDCSRIFLVNSVRKWQQVDLDFA